jgi:predicted Zn-dependent protease
MPINLLLLAGGLYAESQGNKDVATAIGAGFLLVQGLWFPKYSRVDENEADRIGLMYMAKAGYDPRAAPRLWKRVYEEQGDAPALLSLMSSHPSSQNRWKALEKELPTALAEYEKATGKSAP